jgi:hypothetical protein
MTIASGLRIYKTSFRFVFPAPLCKGFGWVGEGFQPISKAVLSYMLYIMLPSGLTMKITWNVAGIVPSACPCISEANGHGVLQIAHRQVPL